jgi:hypothetical protein
VTPMVPAWVMKRDGRREPFDADKISQGLYAATEAIGKPNAFLARELADSVLHFLGQENTADEVPTAQIAELVEKVVRELGQPELAMAYSRRRAAGVEQALPARAVRDQATFNFSLQDSPDHVVTECLRAYSLRTVFGRDLAAAHADGLLDLSGLETPRLLEAIVVDPSRSEMSDSPWKVGWSQVRDASRQAVRLVFDNPELLLAAHGPTWLEGIVAALEAYRRCAVLNLRPAAPPAWANEPSVGPLFANCSSAQPTSAANSAALVDAAESSEGLFIRWHLQAQDFEQPAQRQVLQAILARTDFLGSIIFTLDRRRQPLRLARGIDRAHPATLTYVGLTLPAFLKLPEVAGNGTKMLAKLPSLMRMAASAGIQKRNYLRRHCPEMARGFLLDRARLVVEPFGMAEVVRTLTGASPAQSPLGLDVARQILQTLRDAAERESRITGLEMIVVATHGVYLGDHAVAEADASAQQKAASALLEILEGGDFHVMGPQAQFTPETCWSYLSWAWNTGHIPRVHLVPLPFVPEP